jgi:hypothetical protein
MCFGHHVFEWDGRSIQSATAQSGRTVEADLARCGGGVECCMRLEVGLIGAVIGSAHLEPELDLVAAQGIFLAPGFGMQEATPW